MMGKASRLAGALALAATLGTVTTPAMAQRGWGPGWGGRGGGWGHYRGGDDGFGVFLGVAALIGAGAIIASSAAKDRRAYGDYPSDRRPDEATVVDACADAAEDEAARGGLQARIRDVGRTRADDHGWTVDGTVDQRRDDRDAGVTRSFTCTYRAGRVADVVLSRDAVAMR